MKQGLFLLLAFCALSAAMVPRVRRTTNATVVVTRFCARQTPCAWATYETNVKIIQQSINNTYCTCAANTSCRITEDDTEASAYIYHCRDPLEPIELIDDR